MSNHGNHEDRAPLTLKIALRQALRRIQEETNTYAQYEALAGNLGWDEVAEKAALTRKALAEAGEHAADAVEAMVRIQTEMVHEHAHSHTHPHTHPHVHTHSHPHEHGHHDGEGED